MSHAADVFTVPSGCANAGAPSGSSAAPTNGFVKNEPADHVSWSPGSSTMPLPRRSARTASRTSASGARAPTSTPSVRASSA